MLYTQFVVAGHAVTSRTLTMIAVGIDCTSGRRALTYAALDRDLRVVSLAEAELDDLIEYLGRHDSIFVAVNSPSHVNMGVIRKRLESQKGASHAIRGAEIREAEHELHARGISIGGTPRAEALSSGWMQLGFELYRRLAHLAFKPFPAPDAERQWLETHPHAGFCALLGRPPLPRPAMEGRLQRALVLFERGVRIHDPMAFLEEITRHRLLHGLLPMELVLAQEQLDALLAAYTAWLSAATPGDVTQLGNTREGFITLPVSKLQDKY
ncbi:MAG: DUF429 domain-containing protein [Chloroflexota bacterium]